MTGTYLPDTVPPQPDECRCEGQPRHIHHPWAWREKPVPPATSAPDPERMNS